MSLLGRWRSTELPGYEADYADMMEPAFIAFESGAGEFAFGCVTGSFAGGGDHHAIEFDWDGNDEVDEVGGHGWAERQADGTVTGKSTSTTAMTSRSSPSRGLLLQQPARSAWNALACVYLRIDLVERRARQQASPEDRSNSFGGDEPRL